MILHRDGSLLGHPRLEGIEAREVSEPKSKQPHRIEREGRPTHEAKDRGSVCRRWPVCAIRTWRSIPASRPRRSTAAASCGNLLRVAAVGLEKGADASLGQDHKAGRQGFKAESRELGLVGPRLRHSGEKATASRLLANHLNHSSPHADAGA
jgi:hypothetical protein